MVVGICIPTKETEIGVALVSVATWFSDLASENKVGEKAGG